MTDYSLKKSPIEDILYSPLKEFILPAITSRLPESGVKRDVIGLFLIMSIFTIGALGIKAYDDTMLSYHLSLSQWTLVFLCMGCIATVVILAKYKISDSVLNKFSKWEGYAFTVGNWFAISAVVCTVLLFLVFFTNKLGGDQPQIIPCEIEEAYHYPDFNEVDIKMPIEPHHASKRIGSDRSFSAGMPCIVTYHTGLFGLKVLDSVDHQNN